MNELIELLMKQLGLSGAQAEGGLGLILKFVKEKLSDGDFSKITDLLGNVDSLINKAPDSSGGGLGKLIGSVLGGDAGDLAGLASGFDKLNIETGKLPDFGQIIMDFLREKGGGDLEQLIGQFLK